MSVITQFTVYSHCNDLGGKVWNPAIKWTHKYAVFVVLESDSGFSGLGECWCFDRAPDTLVSFLRTEIAPHVLGIQVDEFDTLYQRLVAGATLTARHGLQASALSAVDIALWDITSREAGLPLWVLLQQRMFEAASTTSNDVPMGSVRLYGSGGLYGHNKGTKDLAVEMSDMAGFGFDTVKMKVGGLRLSEDVERVLAVLDALDNGCQLIIDGVYSYTVDEALAFFRELPTERIEAFQSPVKAHDLMGMKALCQAGVPVMGTEAEYRVELHQQLVSSGAVRFLQTAPIACGGFARLNQLGSLVSSSANQSVKLSLEVSSTAVALLAASHFAAASGSVAHTEYHFIHQVFFDALNLNQVPGLPGWFQLPDEPGLGMSLPLTSVSHEFSAAL